MKFLKHINSNTIVEVGCGSGFWLKLMQNAGLSCQGHELKSMREKWAFPECYIDDQYITYHIDENDQEYLKEAGAAGKTLFLCYPESEDMHKNMVAYNSAKVYLDACKNAGKTASIIYIGGYYDRDHSVTAGKKFEELLHSAFKQFGNKILLYAPRERAPDSYIHFYVARSV
jgi:hypothetical protein